MRIHDYEGLAPGRCGKGIDFNTCPQTLFMMFKQNSRQRTAAMLPIEAKEIRTMTRKKVKGVVLKNFGYKSLALPGEI